MAATPGSDGVDLKQELKSFRAGLTTRDLILATAVLGIVAVACLTKVLTGWPHFRIIGGVDQIYWFLGAFGSSFGTMLMFTLRTCLGYDDVDSDSDNSGLGGANDSW